MQYATQSASPSGDLMPRSHRASLWKTIVLAFVATLGCVAASYEASFLPSPLVAIAIATLYALATTSFVIILAGLLCLHRDHRQHTGRGDLFYYWSDPAHRSDWIVALYRPLLGRTLRPGDHVRVRSAEEIRRTLDARGTLDDLPFMPEMLRYCGRTFRVHRRVDKINNMITKTGLRRFERAVTLRDLRCDGSAHGGCQAECQILWKEPWLERMTTPNVIFSTGQSASKDDEL